MSTPRMPLPCSETHIWVNFLAALFGCVALIAMQIYAKEWDNFFKTLVVISSVIFPILLADVCWLKPHHHQSSGLFAFNSRSWKRVLIKTIGMYGVFTFYGLLYHLFPVYETSFYNPYWQLLSLLMPWIIFLTPFYIGYLDRRLDNPMDEYYHMGNACLLRFNKVDFNLIKLLLRNWLVKAFFLPLMYVYLLQYVTQFSYGDWHRLSGFKQWYEAINNGLYLVDLLFASTGYIMTLRLVNAQIRSSDPTFFGWFIALICYAPFWNEVLYQNYFAYKENGGFFAWTHAHPFWMSFIGTCALMLIAIYVWATIAMGYRFSNLTYRGLVSSGPYRLTKHPAYVAKNLSWWLISLPFLSEASYADALQNCILLLGVNGIYFLRARTEEAHLSQFPEYVAYAEAMNERSIFAPLARLIPALRYQRV